MTSGEWVRKRCNVKSTLIYFVELPCYRTKVIHAVKSTEIQHNRYMTFPPPTVYNRVCFKDLDKLHFRLKGNFDAP